MREDIDGVKSLTTHPDEKLYINIKKREDFVRDFAFTLFWRDSSWLTFVGSPTDAYMLNDIFDEEKYCGIMIISWKNKYNTWQYILYHPKTPKIPFDAIAKDLGGIYHNDGTVEFDTKVFFPSVLLNYRLL